MTDKLKNKKQLKNTLQKTIKNPFSCFFQNFANS